MVIRLKYSLVCHLLSVPAEGAVECRGLFAAQSFSEATVELTEAPQTRDKLPAAIRKEIREYRKKKERQKEKNEVEPKKEKLN